MRRQSTYTFGSFLRQLSRSTPQESKLLMLRNIELFHIRPDMFTKAVAAVPWENALALMDSAFFVLKDIEPKSYQVVLAKVAEAQAKLRHEHDLQVFRNNNGMIAKRPSSLTSASSAAWISSLKLLSRLVQSEGDQTPPSAFSLAAQCLSPTNKWEQAIQLLLKPADHRNITSKALLLNVAESCATPSAWNYGLAAFMLTKPKTKLESNGWLLPPTSSSPSSSSENIPSLATNNNALSLATGNSSTLSDRQVNEVKESLQAKYVQNSRILTKLLAAAPWYVAMGLLVGNNNSKNATKLGATGAILDDEKNMSMLIESWLLLQTGGKNLSNITKKQHPTPPPAMIRKFCQYSSCFGDEHGNNLVSGFLNKETQGMPQSATHNNKETSGEIMTTTNNNSNTMNPFDSSNSSSNSQTFSSSSNHHCSSSPTQLRLLISVALKTKDLFTLATLLNRVGSCEIIGKNRASAALLLLLHSQTKSNHRSRNEAIHRTAIQIAQRCLAEGVRPLSAECLKAIIASYHHQCFASNEIKNNKSTSSSSSSSSKMWFDALALASGLSMSGNRAGANSSPFSSATREELFSSSSLQNTTQFLDESRTLTKLIQLCAVGGNAPEAALRLIGAAKNSNEHQHQRNSVVTLEHEKIVSALLFCQQYGRWREAMTVMGKFFSEEVISASRNTNNKDEKKKGRKNHHERDNDGDELDSIIRAKFADSAKKHHDATMKVLLSILEVILKNEGQEKMWEENEVIVKLNKRE